MNGPGPFIDVKDVISEDSIAYLPISIAPRNGEYFVIEGERWVFTQVDYHLTEKLHLFQKVVVWVAAR